MNDQLSTPQTPLKNATAVLVLGILSILGCFCYGIIGLILAIIALALASKDMKLYAANPEGYTPGSYSNLKAGRICAIIGLVLSCLYFIFFLILIATIGFEALNSGNPQDILDQLENLS